MKRRRFLELAAGSVVAGGGIVASRASHAAAPAPELTIATGKDMLRLRLLTDYLVMLRSDGLAPFPEPGDPQPAWSKIDSPRPLGFETFGRPGSVRFIRRQPGLHGLPKDWSGVPAPGSSRGTQLGIPFIDERGHRGVITSRYIVRMRTPGSNPCDPDVLPGGRRPEHCTPLPGVPDTWALDFPFGDPLDTVMDNEAAVARWRAEGRVRYAVPGLVREIVDQAGTCAAGTGTPSLRPNDPGFDCQKNLALQRVPAAWRLLKDHGLASHGCPDVRIGILDSGLPAIFHPDIPTPNSAGGRLDYVDFGCGTTCEAPSHGTWVFGIIGAVANNSKGISGIAPGCHVVMARYADIGDPYLYGSQVMALAAIPGVVPKGRAPSRGIPPCDIINLSHIRLGGIDEYIEDALETVATRGRGGRGCLIVNASGNVNGCIDGERNLSSSPHTLSVGNTWVDVDGEERRAWQSGWGLDVDLSACGSDLLTLQSNPDGSPVDCTFPIDGCSGLVGTTCVIAGTSFSTATVSAIAGLALSANPTLTGRELRDILLATACKVDPFNADPDGRWRRRTGAVLSPLTTPTPPPGFGSFSKWYGYGRVDAYAAVKAARLTGTAASRPGC